MAHTRVSVVTVCRNSAETIGHTLHSVNAQRHAHVEHIVIDGGSTDATLEIVRSEGRRVSTLVSEPDRGIYDAMNKGIRAATGDVIGMLNSDDFYASPDALGRIAAVFDDPAVDVCYADLCYVRRADPTRIVRYWKSSPFKPGLFAKGWEPPHPTFFARRTMFDGLGLFNLDYSISADTELMARFIEVHKARTRYLPDVLVHMRMGGVSNRSLRNVVHQNREVLHALRRHGLRRSVPMFFFSKLVSRGHQFISRPSGSRPGRSSVAVPSHHA